MHLYINVKSIYSYTLSRKRKNKVPMRIRFNNINHFPIKVSLFKYLSYCIIELLFLLYITINHSFHDTIHG